MLLDREILRRILEKKDMEYADLHQEVKDQYGLDLSYKGFMSLMSNRSTWKLLYAHAISDVLKTNYQELFKVVDVDVDEVKKYKEWWKGRYQDEQK